MKLKKKKIKNLGEFFQTKDFDMTTSAISKKRHICLENVN